MNDDNVRIFKGTYKRKRMYFNGYCVLVTLGRRTRYFHSGGKIEDQIIRTMKEIDDFLDGKIE